MLVFSCVLICLLASDLAPLMGGSVLPVRVYHSGRDHHPVAHQWHTQTSQLQLQSLYVRAQIHTT